jgi:hypothetical protein
MVPERILVACPMKSGSTYIAQVLSLYFGLERQYPLAYWSRQEQNLDPSTMASLVSQRFVLQLHSKPYLPLLRWLIKAEVCTVFTWRNIADALVSLDDHICTEDHRIPACYIHDPATYRALTRESRYAYLIRHATPWYMQFYLMWREADATLPLLKAHYEQLVADPPGLVRHLILQMGESIDEDRLRGVLNLKIEKTRFNRGISGRSLTLFSSENKRDLEEALTTHPEDLGTLVEELPWNGNRWNPDVFPYGGRGLSCDVHVGEQFGEAVLGNLTGDREIRQSIRCRVTGLRGVGVLAANYGKPIPCGMVKLRVEHAGACIRQCETRLSQVQDNAWLQWEFAPIEDSAGKEYDLVVSTEGMPEGFGFTIWYSRLDAHRRGRLLIDGTPQSGTLCMRTHVVRS